MNLPFEVNPNLELWGEIVLWELGGPEVRIDRVRDALAAAGLDPGIAGELRPTTALQRAFREFRENRTIDRLGREGDTQRFQFTQRHLEDSGLFDFTFEAVVSLDTVSGRIECEESPEIEAHARELFAHALDHRSTSDITRMVQGMFERSADLLPLSRAKGVAYFVPETYREFTARVEAFLVALGGRLPRFPVPKGTEIGNHNVRETVESGLNDMLAELRTVVDSWTEKTRESTMENAIEKWLTIKGKCEAYATYFGFAQGKLEAELAAMKAELAAKIQGARDEKARKKETVAA